MIRKIASAFVVLSLVTLAVSCAKKHEPKRTFTGAGGEVEIITLDPGHFHAALVQKTMYDQVSPVVHVYAPPGPEVDEHLNRIEQFNTRPENPTSWREKTYIGNDFLRKMLAKKPGNVVVISGNNRKKAEYIKACVDAGLNVFADKPMCINSEGFELLEEALDAAEKNSVLLYDIMTERSEITSILQKELVQNRDVFGQLDTGTVDNPAVIKESVHHFFKYVAGKPLKRPPWYLDTTQQGEGIVDVTTHLVDLVMWGCFPEEAINYHTDVEVKKAQRWPTLLSRQEYQKVTGLEDFPDFLKASLDDRGLLACYANGEITFALRGVHARVSVNWKFEAPEGAKDTHYSMMRGTKAIVTIRQGKEQNYTPELYVEPADSGVEDLGPTLAKAIVELQTKYPGVQLREQGRVWQVLIPDKYRLGHEAHFADVTERYLKYLVDGKLPDWEIANIKAKYYITTTALGLARQ